MERQIIRIDEAKCDGCGLCAEGCPEGALQMIEGKARLVSEITCDGLGACIGECPRGAIAIETREAAPHDEASALAGILPMGAATLRAHLRHLHQHGQTAYLAQARAVLAERGIPFPALELPTERSVLHRSRSARPPQAPAARTPHAPSGCPGSAPRALAARAAAAPATGMASQLSQWPVQLHLISPQNPVFQGADLLLAADCTAFALADFNQRWLPGKKLAIACPKLDGNQEVYQTKLMALIDQAELASITVLIMEVPCCGGLLRTAQMAVLRATRKPPIRVVVVGIDGELRREA